LSTTRDLTSALARLLNEVGSSWSFDPGRNNTHPCTFCAAPAAPAHRLRNIGRYTTGMVLTRPVCEECSPIADELEAKEREAQDVPEGGR